MSNELSRQHESESSTMASSDGEVTAEAHLTTLRLTAYRITDGRQVRAVRAILGMTQREMGKAAEVDRNTVWRAEKQGRLPPRSYAAERLGRFAAENGIRCETIDGKPAVVIIGL